MPNQLPQIEERCDRRNKGLLLTDLHQSRRIQYPLGYCHLGQRSAHVVNTLKNDAVQHCLIVNTERRQLRGIISVGELAERLGINLAIQTILTFVPWYKPYTRNSCRFCTLSILGQPTVTRRYCSYRRH